MSCSTLFVLLAAVSSIAAQNNTFGYEGHKGPSHWADEFHNCAGKLQSPIDIEEHLVTHVTLKPLLFHGFHARPSSATLQNNGHTVVLQFNSSDKVSIAGGPLVGTYEFQQLHFHWGQNDSIGSEDTINNHSFPMELHLVFTKISYGSYDEALRHHDGICVLAFFYNLSSENPTYVELVEHLPRVSLSLSSAHLEKLFPLNNLLNIDRTHYYTYNGSLTTPPCAEVVTWIDFKEPIPISHNQIEAFRKLHTDEGFLTHNFRPVQPRGERSILYNMKNQNDGSTRASEVCITVLIICILSAHWLKN